MKIILAQQNYHIGNIEKNTAAIIRAMEEAQVSGADLIVFSELSVCGYPPKDLLYSNDFIDSCDAAIRKIAEKAVGIAALVGAPQRNPEAAGKNLYNAAYFLENGAVSSVIHKTCIPTYDVFDEDRYFEPAHQWNMVILKGKKIAVTICEDIWNLGEDPMYADCPMDRLLPMKPDLMINLSASPFDYTHRQDRKAVIKANVLRYRIPLLYCNAVGSQTELVFDGSSMAFNSTGNCICELSAFEEDKALLSFSEDGSIASEQPLAESDQHESNHGTDPDRLVPSLNIEQVYKALVMGIQDYFRKMGFSQAILGSSGGIDSAVTQCLATEALGPENVHAVLLPSGFSSQHSVTDALALCNSLGNSARQISIQNLFETFLKELQPHFEGKPFGLAEENNQSRIRGNILMTLANKFGYILLNTSNKSELATGYGTLYGDMAGGISVLGDCYKLQVYELAKYINRNKELIPSNILTKPPSAELRPDQKDSDSLPEYDLLDPILYQYIEQAKGSGEIEKMGFDRALTERIIRMVNNNEYKRHQFCPVIRISPKAFGSGRRMPIVAQY
jgi:NAD+ synthase (glutamine-hydrolysing)